MLHVFIKGKFITISLLFLALFSVNLIFDQNWLGIVLMIWYLGYFGPELGKIVAPKDDRIIQAWLGIWFLLSAVILWGSSAYYLFTWTAIWANAFVLLTPPVIWLLKEKFPVSFFFDRPHRLVEEKSHQTSKWYWLAATIFVVTVVAALSLLNSSATTEAVRSLWEKVDPTVFIIFFIGTLLLVGMLWQGQQRINNLIFAGLLLFTILNAAILVFPIGYGFDTFIHGAAEERIAQTGTLTPKPLYYIGQYALVLFPHYAFHIPHDLISKFLLPLLLALLLPMAWYSAAAHLSKDKRNSLATVMGLFLIPLSGFIVTTPQGLANLWTMLAILAMIPFFSQQEKPWSLAFILPALAGVIIHPIAGLPLLFLLLLCFCEPVRFKNKLETAAKIFFWMIFIIGSVALPLSFILNAKISGLNLSLTVPDFSWSMLSSYLRWPLTNHFKPIFDFIYFYKNIAALLFLVIGGYGAWRFKTQAKILRLLALSAAMIMVNYLLLSTVFNFSFLIDYERMNYAERLLPLCGFFLIPFFLLGLLGLFERLAVAPQPVRTGALLLTAMLITGAFYLTYPRNDAYERSHGFNTSAADLHAVQAIDQNAVGLSYAVLANQAVAAAAMKTFGFAHYFGDQYFYPIPTGGNFYSLFLEMNDKPNRQTIQKAAQLMQKQPAQNDAQIIYYVVNDYWWQAPRLIETAKQTADGWFEVDEGKIVVFRYDL